MRPEAVTPPPQKEWCPANMAAVFGLFMGSVAICNVSSLQVLRWFFASSLLELHVVLWGCGVVVCVCVFVLLAAWVEIVSNNNPKDQLLALFSSHSAPAGCQRGSPNHIFSTKFVKK